MTSCPDERQLAHLVMHGSEEQRRALDAHVRGCAQCQGRNFGATQTHAEGMPRPRPPAEATRLPRGAVIGRYVILEHLGTGGMGEVYAAHDPQLDRKVALKRVRTDAGPGQARTDESRLLREARALAKLSHPNVVSVHEVGTHEGSVYIAMEFVAGTPLHGWLRSRTPTWRELVQVFAAAGRGLAAAHAAGLVHRDFKPHNVLIGADGRIRVLDFGLARAEEQPSVPAAERPDLARLGMSEPGEALTALTVDGMVLGTPEYMAPEQWRAEDLDARTDQFAFCLALFEALYGVPAFRAVSPRERVEQMEAGAISEVPADSQVPRAVYRALRRGLSANPADRFPSIDALLAELDVAPRRLFGRTAAVGAGVALGAILSAAGFVAATPSASNPAPPATTAREDPRLRALLEEAWRQLEAGDLEGASRSAERLEREASGTPHMAAEATLLRAWIFRRQNALDDAERALHRAAQQADESGDDLLRARAFVALVRLVGVDRGQVEQARTWSAYATASLQRAGRPAWLVEQLDEAILQLDAQTAEASDTSL